MTETMLFQRSAYVDPHKIVTQLKNVDCNDCVYSGHLLSLICNCFHPPILVFVTGSVPLFRCCLYAQPRIAD